MTRAQDSIDNTDVPELRRIAEEVRDSNEPRILHVGDEDVVMLVPCERPANRYRLGD